jgi:hypothetical protein
MSRHQDKNENNPMNKEEAIKRIKKCLALASCQGAGETEAETALRQAQALMEKFAVDDTDLLASGVSEAQIKASAKQAPTRWECRLADAVAQAFGCRLIFSTGIYNIPGKWKFIGCGSSAEIATYAFEVVARQARKARSEYQSTKLRRYKRSNKTLMTDAYAEGWVSTATRKINAFAGTEQQTAALEAYIAKHYPDLDTMKAKAAASTKDDRAVNHWANGRQDGHSAELHRGV